MAGATDELTRRGAVLLGLGGLMAAPAPGPAVGTLEATRAALKAQIIAQGGMPLPLPVSPIVSDRPDGSSSLTGASIAATDPRLRFLNGLRQPRGDIPPANGFFALNTLTLSHQRRIGQAGAVELEISCPRFEILTLSCGRDSDFRLYANGLLSETGFFRSGTDGAARWRMIDFTPISRWAECRSIRIQFLGGGAFGGLKLDRLGELHAPSAAKGLRLCVLGDSITKGAGAADSASGYAARLAWRLGFRDFLISGAEGTGWAQAYRPPGVDWFYPALKDRILQDGIQAEADVYVIAMGLTDLPGIQGAVETTLDRLRRGQPHAMIYVVGPWNPTLPQRPAGRLRAIGNEVKAAASARAGVTFLDPTDLVYTKVDIVHPDQQGHDTIGDWLAACIKADLGQP